MKERYQITKKIKRKPRSQKTKVYKERSGVEKNGRGMDIMQRSHEGNKSQRCTIRKQKGENGALLTKKTNQDPAPIPVLGLVLGAEGASLGTMPTLGSGIWISSDIYAVRLKLQI